MSGLLKADSADSAASDARAVRTAEPGVDEEVSRLTRQIGRLEARLGDSDTRIAALTAAGEDAYEQGRAAGLQEAHDSVAVLVKQLEAGIASSQQKLGEVLAGTERLAALLASECLAKMFSSTADRAGLVCDLIHRQMEMLERSAVLAIEVSSRDFPDADALSRLGIAGKDLVRVRVDAFDDRASGSCVMVLKLGQIDIGLDQQWGALRAMLSDFSDTDARA